MKAWGGINGLQCILPVTWLNASLRGCTIADIERLLCEKTAKLAGVYDRKGSIRVGIYRTIRYTDIRYRIIELTIIIVYGILYKHRWISYMVEKTLLTWPESLSFHSFFVFSPFS